MKDMMKLNDPMGAAINEYYKTGKAGRLIVRSSIFDDYEIPVKDLFRGYDDMPYLEKLAIQSASGRVLDVGAGSGCHSLVVKDMGKESVAIDISGLSVEVMRDRGLDARCVDFYDETFTEKFDTVLMLMNGTGIIGNLDNMPRFFNRLRSLLNPGESMRVMFEITPQLMSHYNSDLEFVSEPGEFVVYVGPDSKTKNSAAFVLK